MKTGLALLALMTATASASPLYSTTATLTGVNGATVGGYYTGPYYLTVGNEQYEAFCDDFPDHVGPGQTWDVDVYAGNETTGAYFTPAQYARIFDLADLAFLPGSDQVAIQQAIWRVTDPDYTDGPEVNAPQVSPALFLVVSGHGEPGERPQEFVARRVIDTSALTSTPEPSTWALALTGAGILACLRWRKAALSAVVMVASLQAAEITQADMNLMLQQAGALWGEKTEIRSIRFAPLNSCKNSMEPAGWSDLVTRDITINSNCNWTEETLWIAVLHEFGHMALSSAAHSMNPKSVMYWRLAPGQQILAEDRAWLADKGRRERPTIMMARDSQ